MSDVLGLLRYSQKPEYCFRSLKVDMSMMPAALCCTVMFRGAPTSLQSPVFRHLPMKDRGVPGCSWKGTGQVTLTLSQKSFSIQFTVQVSLRKLYPNST